ncbi:hypothetical protein F5B20DRAFT_543451 [Whalleya microplaca]|nr:hypothetical protein F5B20DRAFT_543451 [Whalleya microplaca]
MQKPVRSPSDFIYRGSPGLPSPNSPDCSSSIMEPTEPQGPGQSAFYGQHPSLTSLDTAWKEYYARNPVNNTATHLATSADTRPSSEDKIRQSELPYGSQVATPSLSGHCLCYHQKNGIPSPIPPWPLEMASPNYLETGQTSCIPDHPIIPYTADAASDHQHPPVCPVTATANVPVQERYPAAPDQQPSAASSATNERTISIHSSNSEQVHRICTIVRTVHNICLESTKTYLNTHEANRRARASDSPPLQPSRSSTTPDDGPAASSQGQSSPDSSNVNSSNGNRPLHYQKNRGNPFARPYIPPPTNSLLKNISGICNMLWTGSQRDRLNVLNVERLAVETMGRLLAWAETVVLGDYDEWVFAEEEALWRVVDAGRNLCAWLGVPDGIRAMEILEGDIAAQGCGSSGNIG